MTKLGLYAALAEQGLITGADLAQPLGFDTRLVEEWLDAQFVSGNAEYDPTARAFWLTEEQATVLADDSTPAYLVGAQTITAAIWKDEERIRDARQPSVGGRDVQRDRPAWIGLGEITSHSALSEAS